MAEEALYVGVDVAKSTLEVAVTDSGGVRQFARATGALAKTDVIDARILALFGARVKPETRPRRMRKPMR